MAAGTLAPLDAVRFVRSDLLPPWAMVPLWYPPDLSAITGITDRFLGVDHARAGATATEIRMRIDASEPRMIAVGERTFRLFKTEVAVMNLQLSLRAEGRNWRRIKREVRKLRARQRRGA